MLQYFCLVGVIELDRTGITRITKEWFSDALESMPKILLDFLKHHLLSLGHAASSEYGLSSSLGSSPDCIKLKALDLLM